MRQALLLSAIASGAVLGAWLRYGFQIMLLPIFPTYPMGTFAANALGCFAIGLLFPVLQNLPETWRYFAVTGLLGSLTTLSSLAVETVLLLEKDKSMIALVHWAGGAVVGVGLCALGAWLVQKVL